MAAGPPGSGHVSPRNVATSGSNVAATVITAGLSRHFGPRHRPKGNIPSDPSVETHGSSVAKGSVARILGREARCRPIRPRSPGYDGGGVIGVENADLGTHAPRHRAANVGPVPF